MSKSWFETCLLFTDKPCHVRETDLVEHKQKRQAMRAKHILESGVRMMSKCVHERERVCVCVGVGV